MVDSEGGINIEPKTEASSSPVPDLATGPHFPVTEKRDSEVHQIEVKKLEVLPEAEISEYLAVYRDAFDPLDELSPAKQSMTDEEFRHEMTSPGVMKYVVEDELGQVIALACMTTDVTEVPWLSPKYYEKNFPEQFARQAVYFVGTILVHPERRGGRHLMKLLDSMGGDMVANQGVLAFDCCGYNSEQVHLPRIINKAASRLCEVEEVVLDQQTYYAFAYKGPKQPD